MVVTVVRSVVAVIVGYVVFAASAFAIFRITGQAAHATASLQFMVVSTVLGAAFALAGGYVAAFIAGRKPLAHGTAVALLLATGASVSLASTLGHGEVWSQLAALLFMTPSAVLGGWFRARGRAAH